MSDPDFVECSVCGGEAYCPPSRLWQDACDAPKDGTEILIVDEDKQYRLVSWRTDSYGVLCWVCDDDWCLVGGFSQWMPIPEPQNQGN